MLLLRNHTTFLPSVPITIASPFIESCIRARIVLARTIIKLFDFITFVQNSLRSCFLFFFFVTSGKLLFRANDINFYILSMKMYYIRDIFSINVLYKRMKYFIYIVRYYYRTYELIELEKIIFLQKF